MMLKLLLLLLLLSFSSKERPVHSPKEEEFDPSKIVYCDLVCIGMLRSSACRCFQVPHMVRIPGGLEFRQNILDKHNELRNEVASGEATTSKNVTLPQASNMNALSYDIELEYVAECHLLKSEMDKGNTCRMTSKFEMVGENVVISAEERKSSMIETVSLVYDWYQEYRHLNNVTISSFQYSKKKDISHVTQLLWWSHTHLGCARAVDSKLRKKANFMLICLYGGSTYSNDEATAVYLEGAPCSKCLSGSECNLQYRSLCGEIGPVPEENDTFIPTLGNGAPMIHPYRNIILMGCITIFVVD